MLMTLVIVIFGTFCYTQHDLRVYPSLLLNELTHSC